MKFELQREELLKPLQTTIGVVERRQTMPILANVLLQVENDRFWITGTDLEIEMVAQGACNAKSDGSATVSGRKLLDIVRSLPEGITVQCSVDNDRLALRANRSRFSLATLPVTDFPVSRAQEGDIRLTLNQGQLKTLFDLTQFGMAHQDVRYYLNGLLLDLRPGLLRAVATDGHRLSMAETVLEGGSSETRQLIVPRKGILELQKLLGEGNIELQISGNQIGASMNDIRFTSKLVDGRFPDYEKVIPPHLPRTLTVDRLQLRQALSRAAILSNEKFRGVRLSLDKEGVTIRAHNAEQEEAEEFLSGQYQGEPMEIGFNVNYILEPLAVLSTETVCLKFSDANGSCVISAVNETAPAIPSSHVVMPMRL
ncbi:MAG: DNA polymerase III subunit beta [Pseudomonadota bacterium]